MFESVMADFLIDWLKDVCRREESIRYGLNADENLIVFSTCKVCNLTVCGDGNILYIREYIHEPPEISINFNGAEVLYSKKIDMFVVKSNNVSLSICPLYR